MYRMYVMDAQICDLVTRRHSIGAVVLEVQTLNGRLPKTEENALDPLGYVRHKSSST